MIPDTYGHCTRCHKDLITDRVINGEVKKWFLPEYGQIELLLSDGSKMRVVMCLPCQEKYKDTPKEHDEVMECVMAGWEKEIEQLKWNKKKKDEYLDKYSKLKIKERRKEYTYGLSN